MIADTMVWFIAAYDVKADRRVERYVLADDAIKAMQVAFDSHLFDPHKGYQITPAGRMLSPVVFESNING